MTDQIIEIDEDGKVHSFDHRWQPIASAPKDLTEVLIYDADTGFVYIGQYEMHAETPFWSYDTHDLSREKSEILKPTHWMPLPDPPAKAEE